jgi:hypothetical protein
MLFLVIPIVVFHLHFCIVLHMYFRIVLIVSAKVVVFRLGLVCIPFFWIDFRVGLSKMGHI